MGVTCSASLATESAVMSARSFLVRGLLAGLIAGLVAFGVAYLVGEPAINAAIAIEEAGGLGDHHANHAAVSEGSAAGEVPRILQSTAGLLTGTMVAGVTLGGLLGVLSALALGRFGSLGVRGVSVSLAAIGFVSVSLIPFVAYPANPPAIGHPDTIGARTALYFIMLAGSVIAAVDRGAGRARARRTMGCLVRNAERHRRLPAGDSHRYGAAAQLLRGSTRLSGHPLV